MNAAQAKSSEVVELLLKAEADINAKNNVSAWVGDGAGCHMSEVAGNGLLRGVLCGGSTVVCRRLDRGLLQIMVRARV